MGLEYQNLVIKLLFILGHIEMRLTFIEPDESTGNTREIFQKLVMAPNVLCLMANSEPAFDAYAHFHSKLPSCKLAEKYRKIISLAVSQYNDCSYCVALHTSTAIDGGILTEEECINARSMKSTDSTENAILTFTRAVLESRGKVNNNSITEIRDNGFNDQEIVEIIAVISFITFANYIANVGEPELDFLEPEAISR